LETASGSEVRAAQSPLDAVAVGHIRERLREALSLAEGDLTTRFGRFRELVEQVADQADAWELARNTGARPAQDRAGHNDADTAGRADNAALTSRVECALLARPGGEPVEEFLLIPFGEVQVERPLSGRDFVFTPAHAESACAWFAQMGRKLAIDYEHQSFDRYNVRPDGLRPAAGWIGHLEVRDDGLWACDVTWTDRARELLRSGEYRYFSPVIYWTDEDYTDVAALGPVALTNDPAMRGVRPLAAVRGDSGAAPDTDLTLGQNTASPDDPGEPQDDGEAGDLRTEIAELQRQIELLQRQLAAQEADAFVEEGMRAGKIVDSTSMDWREDYLRDPQRTRRRLERMPAILPPGRVVSVSERGRARPLRAVSETQTSAVRTGGIEAADLEAYERALAAGRVCLGRSAAGRARFRPAAPAE